jgi:spore germination cell wall hydrolase CwlJ-like protein
MGDLIISHYFINIKGNETVKKLTFSILLSLLVITPTSTKEKQSKIEQSKQIQCLALNMYHEARGSTQDDMIAVSNVVLNRAKHTSTTPCNVIFKPKQFSWTSNNYKVDDKDSWSKVYTLATSMYKGMLPDNTNGSLYYVHKRVYKKQSWMKTAKKNVIHNKHIYFNLS